MSRSKKVVIVLISAFTCGIVWSVIFLFLSTLHGMTKMFNDEFIFVFANLFSIPLTTTFMGFVFAFLDGSFIGIIISSIISVVGRNISKQ